MFELRWARHGRITHRLFIEGMGVDTGQLHAVALAHPTLGEGVGEAAAAALGLATHVPAPRAKSASAGVLAGV